MLTDRDICMAACTQGRPLSEISVRTAMSPALHACAPDDTVEHAAQVMRQHQVRRLPVVRDDGRPVGVLSLNDISLLAVRQHPSALRSPDSISLSKAAQTFAAVCTHRFEATRLQAS
jgi:CBS-domain-containing membrane protein